jgi:hypothetical protein
MTATERPRPDLLDKAGMEGENVVARQRHREIPFLITIAFLGSFLAIRALVLIAGSAETEFAAVAKLGGRPDVRFSIGRNIILFGYHLHHFYFGVLLIGLAGWAAIVDLAWLSRRQLALVYGVGLGLFMDEIGLLLTWGDYYSSLTYLLSLLLVSLFLNVVFFPDFWRVMRRSLIETATPSRMMNAVSGTHSVIKVVDVMSTRVGRTERTSLAFMGVIYLVVGALILLYPRFLYYWVAGAFMVHGVSSLVRAWQR